MCHIWSCCLPLSCHAFLWPNMARASWHTKVVTDRKAWQESGKQHDQIWHIPFLIWSQWKTGVSQENPMLLYKKGGLEAMEKSVLPSSCRAVEHLGKYCL